MPGVLERRGEDVDLWGWLGWRCLGERERRWRGLGVEDGYGRRGKRRGWWTWGGGGTLGGVRGSGSGGGGCWGWWMGMGGGGNGKPCGACGGRGRWTWGGGGVPDGVGGSGSGGGGGWGWGSCMAGGGRGRWTCGGRWRSWWRPGEQERWERGPGGSWWHLGERERREWVVEARWRCGECRRRGGVCRAGGGAGAPPFAGPGLIARVEVVRRCWRVLGGFAWCRLVLGGGGEVPGCPWIRHVGVWWRQRLVVCVE